MHGDSVLWEVSAVSPTNVWAAGSQTVGGKVVTLIERWNGSAWSIVPSPNPKVTGGAFLYSISAVSARGAWAAGAYYSSTDPNVETTKTLVERWDGKAWMIAKSGNVAGSPNSDIEELKSSPGYGVWAVGVAGDLYGGQAKPLVGRWAGGQWRVTTVAEPRATFGALVGLTIVSQANVWAVGWYAKRGDTSMHALIEHWNGSRWAMIPGSGSGTGELDAIGGVSPHNLLAAGVLVTAAQENLTLVERWNGSVWTTVPSPNRQARTDSNIAGLAVASPKEVWAVGEYDTISSTGSYTNVYGLIERYNGTSWQLAANPDIGASFTAVKAVSAKDVWAVGDWYPSDTENTLIEHWAGSGWKVVPSPNRSGGDNQLNAIAVISSNDIWAAGSYSDQSASHNVPLVEHWNGRKWSIVASNWGMDDGIYGISALSDRNIWAVGGGVEHWNGTSWNRIRTDPMVSGGFNGIAAISPNDIWAVGESVDASRTSTMTQHWDGHNWRDVRGPKWKDVSDVLTSVAPVSSSDVWAAGFRLGRTSVNGLIERWNGVRWEVSAGSDPSNSILTTVTAYGRHNLWAAGWSRSKTTGATESVLDRSTGC
jgi:hypothetical protein